MESKTHQELCKKVWDRLANLKRTKGFIAFGQSKAFPLLNPPQPIFGYIPDLLIYNNNYKELILGEAKTRSDIDNLHTLNQLKSYLKYSKDFKKYSIYYEVQKVNVSHMRLLLYKARVYHEVSDFNNIYLNGSSFPY